MNLVYFPVTADIVSASNPPHLPLACAPSQSNRESSSACVKAFISQRYTSDLLDLWNEKEGQLAYWPVSSWVRPLVSVAHRLAEPAIQSELLSWTPAPSKTDNDLCAQSPLVRRRSKPSNLRWTLSESFQFPSNNLASGFYAVVSSLTQNYFYQLEHIRTDINITTFKETSF